jgi:hypothetical protein
MDSAPMPRPVSLVCFPQLGDDLQLDQSIERRHIYTLQKK